MPHHCCKQGFGKVVTWPTLINVKHYQTVSESRVWKVPSSSNLRHSWSFLITVIVDLIWPFGFCHQDYPHPWSTQALYIDLEIYDSVWKVEQQFLSGSAVFCSIIEKALFLLQELEDASSNLRSVNWLWGFRQLSSSLWISRFLKLTPKTTSINLPDWFWRQLKIISCWLILELSYWFVLPLLFPPPLNVFLRWLQKREQLGKEKLMKSDNKKTNKCIEMFKWTHLKISTVFRRESTDV